MIDEMIEIWNKHRPLRVNTETALKLADELGKLAAKQGLSFDELGYLHKKWGIMRWEKHILMLKIYMETDIEK